MLWSLRKLSKEEQQTSECVEMGALRFAVPALSNAAFSEHACLQALLNFYSRLKALTEVHSRGGTFQAVSLHLLPKTCPPPARGRGAGKGCLVFAAIVLVKLHSGLE